MSSVDYYQKLGAFFYQSAFILSVSQNPLTARSYLQFQILLEPFLWMKNGSFSKVSDASSVER